MTQQDIKSTLPNGKSGIFPAHLLEFDLTDPQFREKVASHSEAMVQKIQQLISHHPHVFEEGDSVVWDQLIEVSTDVPLKPHLLASYYPVDSVDLSFDNYLRYETSQQGRAIYRYLGDAINVYVDAYYSYFFECITDDELKARLDAFMAGSALLVAYSEPLIRAGRSRTSEAAAQRMSDGRERIKYAFELRADYLSRNPTASDSQVADWVAPQLNLKKRTVQNYFSSKSY
ncbi:hypothetical protein BCT61_05475 [Vibrio breoganii]|uniref:hypothetical protein n=1 Tax=Vibrio breoganii TaxID=553239 RepID=UPI000C838689|nr:hypothetical protein [Vibrio breoganii]PMM12473.1 hypothetical protein BCT61_05475 [Vibrio breoganii]